MKKRIVAILLVLSIFCFSLRISKRVYAAGTGSVAVIAAVAMLAVNLISMCNGGYDDTAEALGNFFVETGEQFDYFFNGEDILDINGNVIYHDSSPFQIGVSQIANELQSAFNSGELTQVDGNWQIKGDKIKNVIRNANASIGAMARPNIDFTAGYNCTFLDVDLSKPFTLKSLPVMSEFFYSSTGESYAAVYFDKNRIVFSQYYLLWACAPSCKLIPRSISETYESSQLTGGSVGSTDVDVFLDYFSYYFNMSQLNNLFVSYSLYGDHLLDNPVDHCFVYENGTITYTPVSEVDVSGMNSGLVTTTGNYGDFLKSIDDFSVGTTTVPKLDDLNVVPDDATLSIPVNPDKEISIPEQVGVSIPGVGDTTLAELQGDLNLDIDIPSIIVDKFPFCIPFDFVRFLGILCADPVAPVFRIPISTNPGNLDGWASNQTIGDYINPDSQPLFEIDEEIVIDLSHIPLVQPICYTCFIVGFIFLLLHITPKMIQH